MAGLVPAIHVLRYCDDNDVDARHKLRAWQRSQSDAHVPPLLSRCRHHRRRRRRPRRRECAEKFRPLRPRAGSARPRRRPGAHHHGLARRHLRRRLRLAAFGGRKFLRQNRRTARLRDQQDRCRPGASAPTARRFRKDDRDDFIRALDAFYDRAEQAAREAEQSGRDGPASVCLEPGNRWNPMIDAISTYINGCELDQVSILDMDAYEDTDINWRVRRGYGALIAAYGATCPLALNCAVTLIDHSAKRVRIETSQGTLTADKVIVTVPTNLIADEAIRFHPALAGKGRRRARPAARPRRQGDAGAGRAGGAAERRQSARRHHAHRHGHLSPAPVRPALHRRFFRRPFCAIAGRRRRRRAGRAKHRRDRRPSSATIFAAS